MPRRPRFDEPGYVQHVVQRGNGRRPVFLLPDDFEDYRQRLAHALGHIGGALHAYVLMGNHVHLLLTPRERGGVGRIMQSVSRNYAAAFNRRNGRSGTLWEGRYRASIIDSERYYFVCCRYIELNPVRAGLAETAERYPWSSHRANALGRPDPLVTPHALYRALGPGSAPRREAYAALFSRPLPEATLQAVRRASRRARPLGDDDFRERLRQAAASGVRHERT